MCYATVNDKEIFDLGVLGFACYIIFNSVFRKEDLEMGVLGRGRAGQIAILCNFKLFNKIYYNFTQKIQRQIAILYNLTAI